MSKLGALVAFAIVSASGVAHADFSDMGRTMSNIFTYGNNITTANVLYSAQKSQLRMSNEGTAQHAAITATDFRPKRAGHPLIDQWLASPEADGIGTNVRAIVGAFDSKLRRNNLATSAALALETAAYVKNHRTLTAAEEAPLLTAVNDTLAAAPGLRTLSAADKQQLSDTLLLATALMLQYEQAGDHDASLAIARQLLPG